MGSPFVSNTNKLSLIGSTEPGGVLGRRHAQRVADGTRYALSAMDSAASRQCLGTETLGKLFVFEPGLTVSVDKLVGRIAASPQLAAVGYLYSTEAMEAAKAADALGFPIVSPAATLTELFHRPFFRSLGISIQEQARVMAQVIADGYGSTDVMIITPLDQIFSLRLAKDLEKYLKAKHLRYRTLSHLSAGPEYVQRIAAQLDEFRGVVVFTGYWNYAMPVIRQVKSKNHVIFGNAEWAYNEDNLEKGLSINRELYFVADYAPASMSSPIDAKVTPELAKSRPLIDGFRKTFVAHYGYPPTALVAAIVDTTIIVCEALRRHPKVQRRDFMTVLGQYGRHQGVRGAYDILPKELRRHAYLTRWDGKSFATMGEYPTRMLTEKTYGK